MLFFLSRRRHARQIDQLVKDATLAFEASTNAVENVEAQVVLLHSAVTRLADQVEALKDSGHRGNTWRIIRLWSYVFILAAGAAITAVVGTNAFANPRATSDSVGWETLAVSGSTTPLGLPSAIESMTYDAHLGVLTYDLHIPGSLAGRRFLIILSGVAKIAGKIVVDDGSPEGGKVDQKTCRPEGGEMSACQLVSGIIPRPPKYPSIPRFCPGEVNRLIPPRSGEFSLIHISGLSRHPVNRIDIFHVAYALPGANGSSADELYSTIDGIDLPERVALVGIAVACKEIDIDAVDEATSFSSRPTEDDGDSRYIWSPVGDAQLGTMVVARRNDAERWGNVSVAAAGASAGLAVGILPLAYEFTAKWRRQRRRGAGIRVIAFSGCCWSRR